MARYKTSTATKRTVKYLSICRSPKLQHQVIKQAPDSVIKAICNAAANAERGDVHLTKANKNLFRKYRSKISVLTSKSKSLKDKRRTLQQKGGAFFLAPLLSAVLGSLGSALFGQSSQQ